MWGYQIYDNDEYTNIWSVEAGGELLHTQVLIFTSKCAENLGQQLLLRVSIERKHDPTELL